MSNIMNMVETINNQPESLAGIMKAIKLMANSVMELHTKVDNVSTLNERVTMNEESIAALQSQVNISAQSAQRTRILNDLYSKRMNMIIHGIEDNLAWETRQLSLEHVKRFLNVALKVEDADKIKIIDAHRMPMNPLNRKQPRSSRENKSRPIIFKLDTMFDKEKIDLCLKNLKGYNEGRDLKVYVTNHLPREMQAQKAALNVHFKNAKKAKKKTAWKIDYNKAEIFLQVDGDPIFAKIISEEKH